MMFCFFDCEVFKYDWLFVFKEQSGSFHVFHNDNDLIKEFMKQSPILCGFNNKHYDQFIFKAVLNDCSPQQVKELNDYIISDKDDVWRHPYVVDCNYYFEQCDLKDDCQQGLSLKAIEGHLGLPICESTVDFDIERVLTSDELDEVVNYCKKDVEATEILFKLRKNYLSNKLLLAREKGISAGTALYLTNPKLVAKYLDAEPKQYNDADNYVFPKNLLLEYIPNEAIDFFKNPKDRLTLTIQDCQVTLGLGGIHGALPCYREEATDFRLIKNKDVGSYYPHLMVIDGYCSRSMKDPKQYEQIMQRRMEAKKRGDKKVAEALKLITNSTFGATGDKHNALYDPLMFKSVTFTGQLRLLELVNHLVKTCPSLKLISLNTDGFLVSLDKSDTDMYNTICDEWQERTGFTLEEDEVAKIIQKDVNNYIEVTVDGKVKLKGGMLVRGISTAGAFNINNNATIISKAMIEYFVNDVPIERTINDCNDIFAFQLIAKASRKYKEVIHLVRNQRLTVQRCNRIYASKNYAYGTLIKVHKKVGNDVKIGGLPQHCVIDNKNELQIKDIDKSWYISTAKKQVHDFVRSKFEQVILEEKVMNTNAKSIYEKLLMARLKFLEAGVKKSGINNHAEFKYFELEDIVPLATKIFFDLKCVFIVSFPNNTAVGQFINLEKTDEKITIEFNSSPISEPAKYRMNETQALGAEITYMRRYLYLVLLDIVEADSIDAGISKFVSGDERKQIKEKIVGADKPADELQIKALKSKLKELRMKNPEQEEFIQNIVLKTDTFTNLTKANCEHLISEICGLLA